jgi:hypothetical protein
MRLKAHLRGMRDPQSARRDSRTMLDASHPCMHALKTRQQPLLL